jgi:hypothetical protein
MLAEARHAHDEARRVHFAGDLAEVTLPVASRLARESPVDGLGRAARGGDPRASPPAD